MNIKTTLALLLLLSGVTAYVFFFELGNTTTYERDEEAAQAIELEGDPLLPAEVRPAVSEIVRIDLDYDEQSVTLERRGNGWAQTAPASFPLQAFAIDRVARELLEMRRFDSLDATDENVTLAQLDEPRATITLTTSDGTPITAQLGKRLPGERAYLQLDRESEILVTDDDLHLAIFDEGIWNWRATTLDAPGIGQTRALFIRPRDEEPVTLHQQATRWTLDREGIERADQTAVADTIRALQRLRIDAFTADNPEDLALYGLDRPTLTITSVHTPPAPPPPPAVDATASATGADHASGSELPAPGGESPEPPLVLIVGGPADMETTTRFAAITRGDEPIDVVFTVRGTDLEPFRKTVDDLRDARVLGVAPADIATVMADTRVERYGIIREDDARLRFTAPSPDYSPDSGITASSIEDLANLRGLGFVGLDRVGEGIAELDISITGEPEPIRIAVYQPTEIEGDDDSEPRLMVVRDPEPFGYLVSPDILQAWLDGPLSLRDRTVLTVPADAITQVEVRYPERQTVELVRKPDGSDWTVQGNVTSSEAVPWLISELANLRAETWLETENKPAERTEAELCTITVWTGDAAQPAARITVDAMAAAGYLATDINDWFTLSPEALDALLAEFRSTDLLVASPADIERVVLRQGTTTLELRREANGTVLIDGREAIDPESATLLLDRLTRLRATRLLTDRHRPDPDLGTTLTIHLSAGGSRTLQLTDREPRQFLLPVADDARVAVFDRQPVLLSRSLLESVDSLISLENAPLSLE
ncbi:MAG: DUF4340 domain-containing protein [Phycisphaeraceae bacterium]